LGEGSFGLGFQGWRSFDRVGGFDEIIERDRMEFKRKVAIGTCCAASLLAVAGMKARTAEDAGRKEIEAFNRRYVELHEKMDTPRILALWAEDGVDLMPGDAPMIGREKILAWVEDIGAKMPGYKVMKQEMEFHDIHVCGEWASEWATEHQVVQPPDGKPVIESYGKMAWCCIERRTASGRFSKRCGTQRQNPERNAYYEAWTDEILRSAKPSGAQDARFAQDDRGAKAELEVHEFSARSPG
jgi:ketosteroid isomerase-like protein